MTDSVQPNALQRIVGTWRDLDLWGTRTASAFRPNPGSPLAVDDTDFVGWCISQLAFGGLTAARDHLQAVRIHIEAHNLFPYATGTLLRGALLGAAQTVWLLSPDDRPTRLNRSRALAEEMMVRHQQYLADLQRIAPEPHANTDRVRQHVTMRLGELRALRKQAGQDDKFNATHTVEVAAGSTFGTSTSTEARAEWRALSGSAHGLAWSTLGRTANAVTRTNDPGIVQIEVGGSLDDYLNPYLLAHGIAARGWELLHQRAGEVPATNG